MKTTPSHAPALANAFLAEQLRRFLRVVRARPWHVIDESISAAVVLLGFLAVYWVFRPGSMSVDSVQQLAQAKSLQFADGHPPLMALVWAATDRVVAGPRGMLLLLNTLYWGGLWVVFRRIPLPRWRRHIVSLAIAFFPPVFCILGAIWKDVFMQSALVCLFAAYLSFRATRQRPWLWGAGVMAILAIGVRHNAAAAALPLIALLFAELSVVKRLRHATARRLASLGAAATVSVSIVVVLGLGFRPFVKQDYFSQQLHAFDLAGMSLLKGEVLVDADASVFRKGLSLSDLRATFDATAVYTLRQCLGRPKRCTHVSRLTADGEEAATLRSNWMRAVAANPGLYWRHRSAVYGHLLGLSSAFVRFAGADGLAPNPWGYVKEASPLSTWYLKWRQPLVNTPLFAPWLYLGLCVFTVGAGLRRAVAGGSPVPVAVASSGILYSLSFLFLGGGNDLRYSAWTILCSLLATVWLAEKDPVEVKGLAAVDEQPAVD